MGATIQNAEVAFGLVVVNAISTGTKLRARKGMLKIIAVSHTIIRLTFSTRFVALVHAAAAAAAGALSSTPA